MRARRIKILNLEDTDEMYYGIQITDEAKRKYYASQNGELICSKDKAAVNKQVREFNKKQKNPS